MATSGTYTYSPEIAEVVDEAFERCGVDPSTLVWRHSVSARRSIMLMLSDWANMPDAVKLWAVADSTQALTQGDPTYDAPAGTVAILDAFIRRNGIDTPVTSMSRDEYYAIPTKTDQGLPTRYKFDLLIGTRVITLWQVPENGTDVLHFSALRRLQDVTAGGETLDVPFEWYEAFTADLSWRLAVKFSPEKVGGLRGLAGDALAAAKSANRERTATRMRGR